jgi:hypothetical protein
VFFVADAATSDKIDDAGKEDDDSEIWLMPTGTPGVMVGVVFDISILGYCVLKQVFSHFVRLQVYFFQEIDQMCFFFST